MGYGSISGQARTDVNNPKAFAVCDRCARWFNHSDLRWQYDFRGRTLQNIRILVCETCEDEPQPQLKPRIIPPDPLPIANARVEPFLYDNQDDRTTYNPALPNVDLKSTQDILLSGLQFVDGIQVEVGSLVLVMGQSNPSKNGIYKASTGVWSLQGYDNDTKEWFNATSAGVTQYWELGYNYGAVNVARGVDQSVRLYQIIFSNSGALLSTGAPVYVTSAVPASVNHYDFYTGIYMAGMDSTRVTMLNETRTTQQTGAADGSLNEVPGFSNLVPGYCDIGNQTQAPYGNATHQGLPSGFDELPFAGSIWPQIDDTSIDHWLNNKGQPTIWINFTGMELTFNNPDWPQPGYGASWDPYALTIDQHDWYNNVNLNTFWQNTSSENVDWRNGAVAGVCPPGGEILFLNAKCDIILMGNNSQNNVNFGQIYPNGLPRHIYPDGPPLYIPDGD